MKEKKKKLGFALLSAGLFLWGAFGAMAGEFHPPGKEEKVLSAPIPAEDGAGGPVDPLLWKKALAIHEKAIVIDTHCDVPMEMYRRDSDITKRSDTGHFDLERMREGGADAEFLIVWISNREDDNHPAKQALEILDVIYEQVERRKDIAGLAFSPEDIERLSSQGKRACLIGLENGAPVEHSLRILRDYYRLGVRYCTLTHSKHNYICDSSYDESPPLWNGLSPFGKEMVREMNRLGMMIDISHLSDKSIEAVLKESKAPVVDTHSGVRALCPMERNRSDEQIREIARKGGVLQINFGAFCLDKEWAAKSKEADESLKPKVDELRERYKEDREGFRKAYRELRNQHKIDPPPITCLIDHIDYVVKLVGEDYVGLGSDFDGVGVLPRGIKSIKDLPIITYHLLKRGYSEERITKILGGNFLRVFRAIRDAAQ